MEPSYLPLFPMAAVNIGEGAIYNHHPLPLGKHLRLDQQGQPYVNPLKFTFP